MFIAQAFRIKHDFWRYLMGSLLIAVGALIGQIPLTIALIFKAIGDGVGVEGITEDSMYQLLEPNTFLFLALFSFVVAFIGLIIALKVLHSQTLISVITSRKKLDWRRILFAFIFLGSISSSLIFLDYMYLSPDNYVYNFEIKRFLILAVIAIIFIPIQTSLEEFLFRGYLMQGFGMLAKNRWFPLLMTSAIFGLLHIANPEIDKLGYTLLIYYIGTGLFWGIITLMDEGAELALGLHAANNLFTALLVTSDWTALQTHSILKDVAEPKLDFIDMVLPVFIISPMMLFVFSKVYKWNNWKDKLFGEIHEPPTDDYKIIGDENNN